MIRASFFVFILSFGLTIRAQTPKTKFDSTIKKLQDSAFIQLHYNNFYDAFKLLDSASIVLNNSDNYKLKSRNYNIYGLAYAQVNEYNKAKIAYKKAIALSDSITNTKDQLDRRLSPSLNLQRLYVITRAYDAYYDAYTHVRGMANANKNNPSIFHEYDTEIILLNDIKDYKALLKLCLKALKEIEEKKHLFYKNETDRLNYIRIKSNYEIYYAFVLMELGVKTEEANKLLSKLMNSDLEDILWKKTSQFKNLADIRYYKALYFTKYKKNQDSVRFYLEQYNTYVEGALLYLEEEEHKSSRYLVENIEHRTSIENSNLLLKIEKKNSFKIKIVALSIAVISILSLILLYLVKKSNIYKTKTNKDLENKNQKLHKSIERQLALENKIQNIQDVIARDLHDNFGNRIAGINSSASILMDMNKNRDVNIEDYNKFLNHLNKGVLNLNSDIKDLIWANNSKNNSLSEVILRLQHFVNEFKKTVDCTIKFNKNIDKDYSLPRFWNRQILLIFKEAINNACKHTKCKSVEIEIKAKSSKIEISAKDKGSGFNLNTLQRKSGIINMKKRASSIGCKLIINTSKGHGTEIVFYGEIENF